MYDIQVFKDNKWNDCISVHIFKWFILQYFDGTHVTNRQNSLLALLNQGTQLPYVEINTLAYLNTLIYFNTDIWPIFPYFTDETTRLTQPERRRPTLQEVRLKNYFNSVESSSCASCEHVRIYCVQETVTWPYQYMVANVTLLDKIRR